MPPITTASPPKIRRMVKDRGADPVCCDDLIKGPYPCNRNLRICDSYCTTEFRRRLPRCSPGAKQNVHRLIRARWRHRQVDFIAQCRRFGRNARQFPVVSRLAGIDFPEHSLADALAVSGRPSFNLTLLDSPLIGAKQREFGPVEFFLQ